MSWQASKAVWENSTMTGNAKLLMLAIADHIGESGKAWPGIARLAEMVGVGDRAIKRLIKQCEDAGELVVDRGTGRGNASVYSFPFLTEKGDPDDIKGDRGDTLYESKKGDPAGIKGDPVGTKGDPVVTKGDRTITPTKREPKENQKNQEPPLTPQAGGDNKYLEAVWPLVLDAFAGDVNHASTVLRAQAVFAEVSGQKQPYVNGDRRANRAVVSDWWRPLDEMLGEVDGDLRELRGGLVAAFALADREKLTMAAPSSMIRIFRAETAKMRRQATRPTVQHSSTGLVEIADGVY